MRAFRIIVIVIALLFGVSMVAFGITQYLYPVTINVQPNTIASLFYDEELQYPVSNFDLDEPMRWSSVYRYVWMVNTSESTANVTIVSDNPDFPVRLWQIFTDYMEEVEYITLGQGEKVNCQIEWIVPPEAPLGFIEFGVYTMEYIEG